MHSSFHQQFLAPYDDQCQSKHVMQCTEAFKEGLKDALCVCKKLLNKF
jgi:hypothetical protein